MTPIDSLTDRPQADSATDPEPERDDPEPITAAARGSVPGPSNAIRCCLVALLLTLFAAQVLLTSRQTSIASDEAAQLPAGYAFLKTGLRYLLPEHPPLIPALSALPLLALQPRLVVTDSWPREPGQVWAFGSNFVFSNDADRLLF